MEPCWVLLPPHRTGQQCAKAETDPIGGDDCWGSHFICSVSASRSCGLLERRHVPAIGIHFWYSLCCAWMPCKQHVSRCILPAPQKLAHSRSMQWLPMCAAPKSKDHVHTGFSWPHPAGLLLLGFVTQKRAIYARFCQSCMPLELC